MNDVLNMNNGPKVAMNAISAFIQDDSQSQGVLQLWSNMVAPLVAAGQIDYRAAVKQYMAYYRKLAFAQLRATNLVMEAYNFNSDTASAARAWDSYRSTILEQETTFITWLMPLLFAGVSQTGYNWTTVHALMQLDPGVQYLPSDVRGKDYFEPSPVLRSAEELLARLYLTEPEDRRIVIHLAYQADPPIGPAVDAAAPTLTAANGSGTVAPKRDDRLGAPYPWPGAWNSGWPVCIGDLNLLSNTLYVRRLVFSAGPQGGSLVDGAYTPTNINGQSGLLPMETYLGASSGSNPPFMNDNVINYPLFVDGSQQFDYLNFLAYVVPVKRPGWTS
jgi:hypothetical protein